MDADEIKAWMALNKTVRTREWLAQKCHVAKGTVDGWLSDGRNIPGPALHIIETLIHPKVGTERIAFRPTDWEEIENLAGEDGMPTGEWVVKAALEYKRWRLGAKSLAAETPSAPAAEKPKPVNYRNGIKKKRQPAKT